MEIYEVAANTPLHPASSARSLFCAPTTPNPSVMTEAPGGTGGNPISSHALCSGIEHG
jgi:hypothetical protein